ncbi:hypothetical protein [Sphingomonas sp. S2-65]|uniref:hypothetical protein n=1 Tax=Sphingomonas sp. S2-65 TaxID=2903960 RepID=UPI001F3F3914|nr:hypothetical protein [Sphingomonas sp. S2-65]UYY60122.1 hypothetical protein LZ586_08605 [Sphingomonas sp. S2-65]
MADIADIANDIEQQHLARSLQRVTPAIPAGVAGECDNCGEDMPRLVDGLCGYCRDGRRPNYAARQPVPLPEPETVEDDVAGSDSGGVFERRQVSFKVGGDVLKAIEARSETDDISLGQAALELVMTGMRVEAPAQQSPLIELLTAHGGSLDAVVGDLIRRVADAEARQVDRSEVDAAVARADVAEAKLAAIRSAMA